MIDLTSFSDLYSLPIKKEGLRGEGGDDGGLGKRFGEWWCWGGGGGSIYRRFLLGLYNYFKRSSKSSMSFIFYINNGFAAMATVEQFQGYYQNLGGYYSANDQLYLSQAYPQALPQNDLYANCDAVAMLPTEVPKDDPVQSIPRVTGATGKQKRRMEKTVEKEILSAKKNSESNIINQFYSFFSSREKSERIVEKCCLLMGKTPAEIQKILPTFYMTIRFINAKRGRKYVNVSMFTKFFTEEEFSQYLCEMKEKVEQLDYLSVEQLCEIFRRCAKYYLKEVSINAILTSKRISVVSKEEHLKKRRKVLRTVMGN